MVSKEQQQELADAIHSMPGFRQTAYMADCIAERIIELGWEPPTVVLSAEQEINIMDRIISGLPTRVLKPANPEGNAVYPKGKLYDVASLHPVEVELRVIEVEPTWMVIPNFENYEICRDGEVRNKWTKRLMEVEYENCASYIEMHDKDGFSHKVSTMTLAAITEKLFA